MYRRVERQCRKKKKLPTDPIDTAPSWAVVSIGDSAGAYGITNNRGERERGILRESPRDRRGAQSHVQRRKGGSRRAGAEIQPPRNLFRSRDLIIPTSLAFHPPLFIGVHGGADLLGWESARGKFGGRFGEFSGWCRPREGGEEGVREGLVSGMSMRE